MDNSTEISSHNSAEADWGKNKVLLMSPWVLLMVAVAANVTLSSYFHFQICQ